ncbi:lipocalin family protein [uncultured Bacteroides sp.]|uniref:lipocalin family protein n=1 Tax=uncultured Bacteroides sp. TaxID=162156 RepID=UPI0025FD97E5|nr:lipocalin family protein [uncultured Bacteroides sp.]
MKKITFILVVLMATVFSACSSDEDNDSNSLDGTTWVADDEDEIRTLKFQKTTFTYIFQHDTNGDGVINAADGKDESTGTYSLDGNKITIKENQNTSQGTISGDKMVLSANGDSVTYYKK